MFLSRNAQPKKVWLILHVREIRELEFAQNVEIVQ
jgi:hypothetical protein